MKLLANTKGISARPSTQFKPLAFESMSASYQIFSPEQKFPFAPWNSAKQINTISNRLVADLKILLTKFRALSFVGPNCGNEFGLTLRTNGSRTNDLSAPRLADRTAAYANFIHALYDRTAPAGNFCIALYQ